MLSTAPLDYEMFKRYLESLESTELTPPKPSQRRAVDFAKKAFQKLPEKPADQPPEKPPDKPA